MRLPDREEIEEWAVTLIIVCFAIVAVGILGVLFLAGVIKIFGL